MQSDLQHPDIETSSAPRDTAMAGQVNPQQNGDAKCGKGDANSMDFLDIVTVMATRWRLLAVTPLIAGAIAVGLSFLIPLTFTAKTLFLPPQQQQSSAASALASLGALSGLAGAATGIKSPADQYISLMQSANVEDRIIDKFNLMALYKTEYRFQARAELEKNVRISLGKKDGLITIEADANSPQLAADLANEHVAELRRISAELALTEAQQRRLFFETQVKQTKIALVDAQQVLQRSGFNPGALKAEPKAAADSYARIRAEATTAEVRLQTMRRSLADAAPEVQQQLALLGALRGQLANVENASPTTGEADYISRYRDFKYQEVLFDLFSKQYELARVDESREGALIQIIDTAKPPEYKSKPKRAFIGIAIALTTFFLLCFYLLASTSFRFAAQNPKTAAKFTRLRAAAGRH